MAFPFLSSATYFKRLFFSIAFSGFATAIEEARLEVEKYEKQLQVLDDLAQQPTVNVAGYASMATAFVNANQTKKAQEGLEEQTKKSTANFFEFIAAQEDLDASTKSAIATLGREREEYKGMTNEALGLNKVTEAYIKILDEMAEGNNVDIADVLKKREAVIGLASTISALNRATEENIKKFKDRIVGIGETGLDYHYDIPKNKQIESLEIHLDAASVYNLSLIHI